MRRATQAAAIATQAAAIVAAASFVGWAAAASSDVPSASGPDIVGRFALTSEAGGAVWALEEDGDLYVVGPGDLIAEGAWSPGPLDGLFAADVEVPVTGQRLDVMGAVSPDGLQIALHVRASEAATPGDGVPWPALSLLHGQRVGLAANASLEPTASPSSSPVAPGA
jgi:hypothetical protein